MIRNMTRAGVLSSNKDDTRKRLQLVVNDPSKLSEELVDTRFAVYRRPSFIAALDDLLALTHPEHYRRWALTPEVLARIKTPVLVVHGDNDKGEGVTEGRFLREGLAQVKSVIFMKTGHWPPYERPDDYSRLSLAFLDKGLDGVQESVIH